MQVRGYEENKEQREKGRYDHHIENIRVVIRGYEGEIDGLKYILRKPSFCDPNLRVQMRMYRESIMTHQQRLASLEKMKANEPITREDYDQLMQMPILRGDTAVSNYARIIDATPKLRSI